MVMVVPHWAAIVLTMKPKLEIILLPLGVMPYAP